MLFDIDAISQEVTRQLIAFRDSDKPNKNLVLCCHLVSLTDCALKITTSLFEESDLYKASLENFSADLIPLDRAECKKRRSEKVMECFDFLQLTTRIITIHNMYCPERDRLSYPDENISASKRKRRQISVNDLKRSWLGIKLSSVKTFFSESLLGRFVIWLCDVVIRTLSRFIS